MESSSAPGYAGEPSSTSRAAQLVRAYWDSVERRVTSQRMLAAQVNQDSDGPVEICVPIRADASPADGGAVRTEPAHREAFVRVTRAQFEFPQILSAYDAVAQWISANGHTIAGSPREIYFTDFMAAKPTDEVADIAFPMR